MSLAPQATSQLASYVGSVGLEALKLHDFLLYRACRYETIHVDDSRLAEAVCSVDGLEVLNRIPIMIQKNDDVGA